MKINAKFISVCTIADILEANRRNLSLTAKMLGVNRGGLRKWVNSGVHRKMLVSVTENDTGDQEFTLINHAHTWRKD